MELVVAFLLGALIGRWGFSRLWHGLVGVLTKGKPQEPGKGASE
jgi:hypothetical protein